MTRNDAIYPTVINEALILGIPVVSNDIPSAHEMLAPGKGVISDIDHLANAIVAAQSMKVQFVGENQEILQRLDELFGGRAGN